MGFTRYWARTEKPITQEFIDEVNKIIERARKKGIKVAGWDGNGEPIVTFEKIELNGADPLDHETFCIGNNPTIFDFCKTAEKPYDYVVKNILSVAKKMNIVYNVSSDGRTKMITDEEYLRNI